MSNSTKRSARNKRRIQTDTANSANAPADMSSPTANGQTPSLLEQATGMLSGEEVKDLIRMSRGIGTPGREMQDLATRIVGHTDIHTLGDKELSEAFGTTDRYFIRGLIGQILTMGSIAGDTRMFGGDGYDFVVSLLRGKKPKDQIAAMLLTQMAATHMAIIEYVHRLARTKYIEQHDINDRTLGKMLRTFVAQVEAFERYQSGAQQKTAVQNVSVNGFGQAIVANVNKDALERAGVSKDAVECTAETPALVHSKEKPITESDDWLQGSDLEREYQAIAHARKTKSSS